MANRQVFPASIFPLRGDISAETGATSVIVQGLQGIPIIAPPVEPIGLDTLFYDSYNNDWFYASPWDIPVGTPLVWEGYSYGSSGISWIAPDTLAFGNGTDGDVSGAAAMTALVLFGSASYYGPYNDYDVDYGPSYDQFYTSVFSGATQNWNLILPPNPGAASQVLTTNGTGVTYWSTISVPALVPNKTLYVDNTRTDSFTPNGTIAFPFATITAAINQVIANGDNATYTYLIDIQPSVYAETINIGNASLYNLMFEGHGGAAAAYASSGTPMPGAIVQPASGNALQGTTNVDQIKILQFSGLTFLGPVNITDTVSNNLGANGFAFVNCCFGGNVTISAATGYVPLQFVSSAIGFGLTVAFTYCAINWITSDMNWGTMNLANTFMEVVSWALNPQNLNINAGSSVAGQDGVNVGAQTVTVASGGRLTLINAIVTANLVINSGGVVTNYLGAIQGTITNNGTYTIAGTATNFSADIMNAGTGFRINSVATSGQYLRGNGTNFVSSAIQAGDISAPGSTGDILYNNGGVLGAALTTITAAGSLTLPDTQVIKWGGSAYSGVGLSQLAADTLAVGNGNESDVSGAMAMTALILYGSSYYSAYDAFQTTILSGATTDWALVLPETSGNAGQVLVNIGSGFTSWESLTTLGVPWSALTNPTANLSLTMGTDTTTFNYATGLAAAWTWQNNTPTVTGASTTLALSTSTAPTHSGGISWTYTLAATESGAGSNNWVNALVTISGYTGGATGNNGASLLVTASTTTTVTVQNATGTTINTGTPVMISSAVSSSPVLQIAGTVNTGTAGTLNSVADVWSIQNVIGSVVPNPTSTLTFTHSGSSGTASVTAPIFSPTLATGASNIGYSNGGLYIAPAGGRIDIILSTNTCFWEFGNGKSFAGGSGQAVQFTSNANPASGGIDTCISRISAGILGIGTGAQGSIAGSIQCSSIALNGAVASPTAGVYYSGTNAGITQTAEAVGTLATTGGIVTTFTAVSDERLKDFFEYDGGLAEVLEITPIRYRWNETGVKYSGQSTERDFIGFSAQDVRKVIPEATWISKDDYLGFDDRPVIAALVNAIKELEARLRKAGL